MYYLIYDINKKTNDAEVSFTAKSKEDLRRKIIKKRNEDYSDVDREERPNMLDYLLMLEDAGYKIAYKETENSIPKMYDVTDIVTWRG